MNQRKWAQKRMRAWLTPWRVYRSLHPWDMGLTTMEIDGVRYVVEMKLELKDVPVSLSEQQAKMYERFTGYARRG